MMALMIVIFGSFPLMFDDYKADETTISFNWKDFHPKWWSNQKALTKMNEIHCCQTSFHSKCAMNFMRKLDISMKRSFENDNHSVRVNSSVEPKRNWVPSSFAIIFINYINRNWIYPHKRPGQQLFIKFPNEFERRFIIQEASRKAVRLLFETRNNVKLHGITYVYTSTVTTTRVSNTTNPLSFAPFNQQYADHIFSRRMHKIWSHDQRRSQFYSRNGIIAVHQCRFYQKPKSSCESSASRFLFTIYNFISNEHIWFVIIITLFDWNTKQTSTSTTSYQLMPLALSFAIKTLICHRKWFIAGERQ